MCMSNGLADVFWLGSPNYYTTYVFNVMFPGWLLVIRLRVCVCVCVRPLTCTEFQVAQQPYICMFGFVTQS
jgi:hypothetical protein